MLMGSALARRGIPNTKDIQRRSAKPHCLSGPNFEGLSVPRQRATSCARERRTLKGTRAIRPVLRGQKATLAVQSPRD